MTRKTERMSIKGKCPPTLAGILPKKEGLCRRWTMFVFILAGLMSSLAGTCQELRCNINIVSTQVQGSNKSIIESLQTALYEFMNNRTWTEHKFSTEERIECNMHFNISSMAGSEFSGTLQIQSRRPIFNSAYSSPMLNIVDKNIRFSYIEGQSLDFDVNSFTSNLTSIFAYYAYIIIGMDYDSFSLYGGSAYYALAERIVQNAQNQNEIGWKAYEGNYKNRYWLVQNLVDDRYKPAREFIYKYHRLGMDRLATKMVDGRQDMVGYFTSLQDVYRRKPDQQMYLLQILSEAKGGEWVDVFKEATNDEKLRVHRILKEIDATNSSKYDVLVKK